MSLVGKFILIEEMQGEPEYTGRFGIIERIDDIGQLHGSWGGCAISMAADKFRIVEETDEDFRELFLNKLFYTSRSKIHIHSNKNHEEIKNIALKILKDKCVVWDDECLKIIAFDPDFTNFSFISMNIDDSRFAVEFREGGFRFNLNLSPEVLLNLNPESKLYERFCFHLKEMREKFESGIRFLDNVFNQLPEEDQLKTEVMYNEI